MGEAKRRRKSGWDRGATAKVEYALHEAPETLWLRAEDFCKHFGITLDEFLKEWESGRIKVTRLSGAASLNAADAMAWVKRRRMH